MAWTKEQQAAARRNGWGVFDVWVKDRMRYVALPLQFNSNCPNAEVMFGVLFAAAKTRNPLATAALKHITANAP